MVLVTSQPVSAKRGAKGETIYPRAIEADGASTGAFAFASCFLAPAYLPSPLPSGRALLSYMPCGVFALPAPRSVRAITPGHPTSPSPPLVARVCTRGFRWHNPNRAHWAGLSPLGGVRLLGLPGGPRLTRTTRQANHVGPLSEPPGGPPPWVAPRPLPSPTRDSAPQLPLQSPPPLFWASAPPPPSPVPSLS